MIHLLLTTVLIAECKAQYGEVAPPAPVPPSDYMSYASIEISKSTEASKNEYERTPESPPIKTPQYEQTSLPVKIVTSTLPERAQGPSRELQTQPSNDSLGPPQSPSGLSLPPTPIKPQITPTLQLRLIPGISQPVPHQAKLKQSNSAAPQLPKLQPTAVVSKQILKPQFALMPPQKPVKSQPNPVSHSRAILVSSSPVRQISKPEFLSQTTTSTSSPPRNSQQPIKPVVSVRTKAALSPSIFQAPLQRRLETPRPLQTISSTRPKVVITTTTRANRTNQMVPQLPLSQLQPISNTLEEVSKPVRLPSHTPITGPAQADREGAKGLKGLRIPSGAETNLIAPPSEEKPSGRFHYTDCTTDTLFVVDSTSSVRRFFEDHRLYIIKAIKLILPDGDNETRIGIIEYSSPLRRQIKLPFGVHRNRTEVIDIVRGLPFFSGITATGAALNLTIEALQQRRPEVPTNIVVITDGFSYDLVDGPASVLHRLPNVRTFTATVTDSWRQYELETIAGDPSRIFKGRDSVRNLVTALTSCSDGPRRNDSRSRNPSN